MAKPVYQFRFRKDATTYYAVDAGSVVTSPSPVNVLKSIIDWSKLQLQWKRHSVYHGVMRNYSPEVVQVANDGAKIVRYVFNTSGDIEALCELEIYKLNTADQQYYPRGVCAIDFSKYANSQLSVSVALMEGGLSARLQGYDTVDFTIPLGDPATDPTTDYLWISGDPGVDPGGVMLLGQYNYQSQADGQCFIINTPAPARNFEESTLGILYVNEEGAYSVLAPGSPMMGVQVNNGGGGGIIDNANIANAIQPFTGTFSGSFDFATIHNAFTSSQNINNVRIRAHVFNTDWAHPTFSLDIWTDPLVSPSSPLTPGVSSPTLSTGLITFTHNFVPGDFIVIAGRMETPTSEAPGMSTILDLQLASRPTDLQLNFQFRQADTPCRAISHYQLFRKLFHALTDSTAVDPVSNLLTTAVYPGPEVYNLNPTDTFYTCGDALRQLYQTADGTPTDPSIKTNISEFATDALQSLCAGIGIERDISGNEVLRLEHLRYFYRKDILIADLGENIANWKMSRYTENIGNQIKAGYNDIVFNEVNGRFEFNSGFNWQTSVTRVHRDIEARVKYHTGCYDCEYVRANLTNKKTTDSGSDNETFKIQSSGNRLEVADLSPNPYEVDKSHTITVGLPAIVGPTVYNVALSPGRQLGRLKPWLKSLYYGITTPLLKFVSGTKNIDLISTMLTGPLVNEKEDIDLTPDGTGEDILFKPWVFEFEAQVPIDLPDLMEVNPYGVFGHTFIRGGRKYYLEGFVLECGISDGTNNVYNFKLLCSPNTVVPEDL